MKSILIILFGTIAMIVFSACPIKDINKKNAATKKTPTEAYRFKYHTIVSNLERDCANSKLDERLYWLFASYKMRFSATK